MTERESKHLKDLKNETEKSNIKMFTIIWNRQLSYESVTMQKIEKKTTHKIFLYYRESKRI